MMQQTKSYLKPYWLPYEIARFPGESAQCCYAQELPLKYKTFFTNVSKKRYKGPIF